jgi:hypothetical protein
MTVRQTSIDTYRDHGFMHQSASDRAMIEQLVRQRGPMTRREIASFLHMETSSVAGRCHELIDLGSLVELPEKRPCPITKRMVTWLAHSEHATGFQMGLAV